MTPAWFTSDLHFGHTNIIRYCARPYRDVEEMDRDLIARYRARVRDTDTVLFLGDVFLCPAEQRHAIMRQLPGHKLLVRGNHDRPISQFRNYGFEDVCRALTVEILGRPVLAQHRPDPEYPDVMLHGHTHKKARRTGLHIHVGVDAWGYGPVSLAEVEGLLREIQGV